MVEVVRSSAADGSAGVAAVGQEAEGQAPAEADFAVRLSPYAVATVLRACALVDHANPALFEALTWRLRCMGAAEVLSSMGLMHAYHILESSAKLRYRNFEMLQAAVSRLVEEPAEGDQVRGSAHVSRDDISRDDVIQGQLADVATASALPTVARGDPAVGSSEFRQK